MNIVDHDNEAGIGVVEVRLGSQLSELAEMRTLDSFDLNNVSLIKIDVEGGENEVLDGMLETIKKNRPVIIIEIQGGSLWEVASSEIREKILDTKKKLKGLDYTVKQIVAHDYLVLPNKNG